MSLLRAIFSIPVLPLARRHGWWSNRRNPDANWLAPNDLMLNVGDSWQGFSNRIPRTAWIHRDRHNEFGGSSYQPSDNSRNNTNTNNPFGT